MTTKRDLKRRIRARQEKTGERYTTARAHVLGKPAAPDWVIELEDVSEQAQAAAIVCPVRMTAALARHAPRVLTRLREILQRPIPGLEPMRHAALIGAQHQAVETTRTIQFISAFERFAEGLRLGLRGPGPGGWMLAFDLALDGTPHTLIAQLLPRHESGVLLLVTIYKEEKIRFWPFGA